MKQPRDREGCLVLTFSFFFFFLIPIPTRFSFRRLCLSHSPSLSLSSPFSRSETKRLYYEFFEILSSKYSVAAVWRCTHFRPPFKRKRKKFILFTFLVKAGRLFCVLKAIIYSEKFVSKSKTQIIRLYENYRRERHKIIEKYRKVNGFSFVKEPFTRKFKQSNFRTTALTPVLFSGFSSRKLSMHILATPVRYKYIFNQLFFNILSYYFFFFSYFFITFLTNINFFFL